MDALPCVYAGTDSSIDIREDEEPIDKDQMHGEIRVVLDAYYQMEYKRAEELLDNVINKWPDHPLPYLAKGAYALERFRFHDDNTKEENKRFKEIVLNMNEKAIELAKEMLKASPNDPETTYYVAAGYGNIGRFYAINRQWWKAFWKGKNSINLCKKVVRASPDYYDAYLGLGIFHYFSATLPKVVKILSFLLGASDGDKDKGISEIKMAGDNSDLLAVEARRILRRIYYWEEDWVNFHLITKYLFERYPENTRFNIYHIYGLSKTNRFEEALTLLNQINLLVENDPSRLPVSTRTLYYRYSGYLNFNTGEYKRATQLYLEAVKLHKKDRFSENEWAEDFFSLASSYAYLSQESMAFKYLKEAVRRELDKESVRGHPAWKQYKDNPIFIRIIGS
ncbi:MAG: tetratricopeptide repeat protein [Candidatus Anammoxibacter sp.]